MKETIIFVGWLAIILSCLIFSGYLALNGKEGWGWFMFMAVLFGAGFSYSSNDDKKEEK